MRNPTEEYDRLHDHCQALARERDYLKRRVEELEARIEYELTLNVIDAELKVAENLRTKFTL
jgi:hypothetical protein